jgi:hypothetical protein
MNAFMITPDVKTEGVVAPNMVYRGEWKNDMRHGFGIQDFYDGSKFEGQFVFNS